MRLWRISEFADLSGAGGRIASGRWNIAGAPIVYTAESSALAMLEVLVGIEPEDFPPSFQLLRIEAPDTLETTELAISEPPGIERSRAWGSAWLAATATPLASVPSAIAPFSRNILINPEHPDAAAIRVTAHGRWPWDRRLFRTGD